jgi:SAM-dependent methyltransferase
MDATGPNAEQIRYWNETSGPKWVARQSALDQQLAPLGGIVADRLGLAPGERVLDVGCGCGESTLELARRVGPDGRVVGVDVSATMLARAGERVAEARLGNVALLQGDAQEHPFDAAAFDVVYSRFGVMFFADPVAAFANLRRALRPGGRLGFVCWQALGVNPWMTVPLQAIIGLVPLPPPPPPGAPGPFAVADRERVVGLLEAAGFTDVGLEGVEQPMAIGGGSDAARAAAFAMEIGPVAFALRDADPAVRPRVQEAIAEALAPHETSGGVTLTGAVWVATGRREI